MRLARLIGPELDALLRENPGEVRELLDEIHPEDLADVIAELDRHQAIHALNELPTEYAAQVFERLEEDVQTDVALELGVERTARIATEMDVDDLADFVGALPPESVAPLLQRLEKVDPEVAGELKQLRRWPESSAGGLMTTEFISVPPDYLISDVINEVRLKAQHVETLDNIYVADQKGRLAGLLTVRDLLLTDPARRADDVMRHNVISVPPEEDQERVAHTLAKYDLNTLPVVDENGIILGVITSDDVFDVLTEEQDEDVQKMGAIEPIEEGYFSASFGMYIRKRAPWLLILFVGGFITTSAMQRFDVVLSTVAQLAFYVPLLISTGGNSGAQSATLVIRGLAVGDIRAADWHRVLRRELGQGLALGAILAALGVLRVMLVQDGTDMALLVAVTIVAIVIVGCVVGGMMPLLLHRLGIDPASSSTPFIATLVDVLGIVIYLGLAQWIMAELLVRAGAAP